MTTLSSQARVSTPVGSRYLQQLCKHWAHKLPVSHDTKQGRIEFPAGTCELAADDTALTMTVNAHAAESLPVLEDVVERHLKRFAFREALEFNWKRPSAG